MVKKQTREGLSVSKYTAVCMEHFQEWDIIEYDILQEKDGDPGIKIP